MLISRMRCWIRRRSSCCAPRWPSIQRLSASSCCFCSALRAMVPCAGTSRTHHLLALHCLVPALCKNYECI